METAPQKALRAMLKTRTQKDIAAESGYAQGYISEVLNGKKSASEGLCLYLGLRPKVVYERIER